MRFALRPLFSFLLILCYTFLLLSLASCRTPQGQEAHPSKQAQSQPAQNFDFHFNQLQRAMTPSQVSALLGPPTLRELKGDKELWHYNGSSATTSSDGQNGRYVIFEKGAVSEFGRDLGETLNGPAKTTVESDNASSNEGAQGVEKAYVAPHSLKIGQHCENDGQCQGDNCHFNRCSGLDNCSVDIGGLCASDGDCCSHYCNFGFCRKKL